MAATVKIERYNFDEEIAKINGKLQTLQDITELYLSQEEIDDYEKEISHYTNKLQGLIVGKKLQLSLDSCKSEQEQREFMNSYPCKMKSEGFTWVTIKTRHGTEVKLYVRYYRRHIDNRRKNKKYPIVYAGLILLGIHDRCTLGLVSQVGQLTATLASLDEARAVLQEQGIKLDKKTIRNIAYRLADRARITQQMGIHEFEEKLSGRRIVISIDGGRTRIREKKRGAKTAKGRNRYNGAWREPKLFIIYAVNEEGKIEKSFMPYMDALIRGPDVLFKLLYNYLNHLNVQDADRVLFVADGATWIWNRTQVLANKLGLKPEQYYEALDFYHAVEHLGKVASLRSGWNSKKRKAWIKKHRKLLTEGKVEQVVESIKEICRGRNSKKLRTERDYFEKNKKRMQYDKIKSLNLPIGSGAVESAIRRVVNLRLKGPCIFWNKESAEAILMLRSYYKAGRWNLLKSMANSIEAHAVNYPGK